MEYKFRGVFLLSHVVELSKFISKKSFADTAGTGLLWISILVLCCQALGFLSAILFAIFLEEKPILL